MRSTGRQNRKKAPVGESGQSPEVARLARKLSRALRYEGFEAVARRFRILGPDEEDGLPGRPSPGLVHLIAIDGYEPGLNVKERLGIRTRCPTCGRRMTRSHRHLSPKYERAVEILRQLEAAANPPPDPIRVYARGGRRVKYE